MRTTAQVLARYLRKKSCTEAFVEVLLTVTPGGYLQQNKSFTWHAQMTGDGKLHHALT